MITSDWRDIGDGCWSVQGFKIWIWFYVQFFSSIHAATDQFSPNLFQFQKLLNWLNCDPLFSWAVDWCWQMVVLMEASANEKCGNSCPALAVTQTRISLVCSLKAQGQQFWATTWFFGRYIQKKTKKQPNYKSLMPLLIKVNHWEMESPTGLNVPWISGSTIPKPNLLGYLEIDRKLSFKSAIKVIFPVLDGTNLILSWI